MTMMTKMDNATKPKIILLLFSSALTVILFYGSFRELTSLIFKSELYSHITLVPFISGYFLYVRRKEIVSEAVTSVLPGVVIVAFGSILYMIGLSQGTKLNFNDRLSLGMIAAVTFWVGSFVLIYGIRSFRAGMFPLLFLFFMAPIPSRLIDAFISILQVCSAEISYLLFRAAGVPVLREGFTFHLPKMSIEVASQCSGIRSSLALIITGLIGGQLFLRTGWRRLALVLFTFPITVFKNGLRIVGLTLLGNYVDARILGSELHKSGGIPFFFIALVFLSPILLFLVKSERKDRERGKRIE